MTAPTTAEEWGRLAVSLPGWRWLPGMSALGSHLRVASPVLATCTGLYRGRVSPPDSGDADGWCRAWAVNFDPEIDDKLSHEVPDADDPATAGCLLELLAPYDVAAHYCSPTVDGPYFVDMRKPSWSGDPTRIRGRSLGRACIAVAAHLGFWPGGS